MSRTNISPVNPYESPAVAPPRTPSQSGKVASIAAVSLCVLPAVLNTALLYAITNNNLNMRDSLYGVLPMPPMWVRIWSYHTLPILAVPALLSVIWGWRYFPMWFRVVLAPVCFFCGMWTWYAIDMLYRKYN